MASPGSRRGRGSVRRLLSPPRHVRTTPSGMWRNASSLGLAALAGLAVACGTPEHATAVPASPQRIVSLAPSITEMLFALGVGDRLVGVCGQCDYPAAVARLPRVGGYVAPSAEAVL